jgi:dTDP-4-dehydrorhamnose reductase
MMKKKNAFLVVGGDSLVGGGLLSALHKRGHLAYASTRRRDTVKDQRVFLDFESDAPFCAPAGVDYAFIVAAATNYDRCEKDPLAYKINVELIPRLVSSLLKQGLFVTFVSTNSVFGGERPWPNEDDPHAPGIAYARQKDEAEKVVYAAAREHKAEQRMNITRLTKILDRNTSPLLNWFNTWKRGETVQAFSDLIFAPMSVQFVGEALATLGEKRISGNLHLSGAENVSYVDFALALAGKMGIANHLIEPTTATARGVHIAFKPRYSGLGMKKTSELSSVRPQTLADVVDDLVSEG